MEKHDIQTLDDIKLLVNTFYTRVQQNDLIGPIFNGVIKDNWPAHLEKMYGFWQTLLLDVQAYTGSPFPKHAKLPVEQEHFDTWMRLFTSTVNELFEGEKAKEAIWRAARMAEMFMYKIDHLRNNPQITPIV
ncbi:MAG: group III truncated hemoglobin [Pedobacter sp.]|nr:MAG: group III truncated hemoglobin [Pedobacter sp.]